MFENIRNDLRAYDGNWGAQGFWVMLVYRFGRWRYGVRPAILRKLFSLIYHVAYKFIQVLTGIELPCEATVGRNFVIDHFGGIIISGYAKFGDNCRIRDGVVVADQPQLPGGVLPQRNPQDIAVGSAAALVGLVLPVAVVAAGHDLG